MNMDKWLDVSVMLAGCEYSFEGAGLGAVFKGTLVKLEYNVRDRSYRGMFDISGPWYLSQNLVNAMLTEDTVDLAKSGIIRKEASKGDKK